jgi:hypothetical protein
LGFFSARGRLARHCIVLRNGGIPFPDFFYLFIRFTRIFPDNLFSASKNRRSRRYTTVYAYPFSSIK